MRGMRLCRGVRPGNQRGGSPGMLGVHAHIHPPGALQSLRNAALCPKGPTEPHSMGREEITPQIDMGIAWPRGPVFTLNRDADLSHKTVPGSRFLNASFAPLQMSEPECHWTICTLLVLCNPSPRNTPQAASQTRLLHLTIHYLMKIIAGKAQLLCL